MMIGGVEHVELKVCDLVRPSVGNGSSRLHIILGRVVDPIKRHILFENQEFLQNFSHLL